MIDRKKVVKGLTNAIQIEKRNGKALVYLRVSDAKDILALLKEQEIKGQISDVIHGMAKQFRRPVMCKDCKYWHESETKKGYGDCGQANGITLKEESWYCADFVRNEAIK